MKIKIISIICFSFCLFSINAQDFKIIETHFPEGGYLYCFEIHNQFYEANRTNIELRKGNENIPNEYVLSLYNFTAATLDRLWTLGKDGYGIHFLLNNTGQVVYVDVTSLEDKNRITDTTKLVVLFNALCTWQKPFEKAISDNPNGLYLIALRHSVFN